MKYINKPINLLICFLMVFISIVSLISPVFADEEDEVDKPKTFCVLCQHTDPDDPLYKKERQFYEKIKQIKSVFGDSIDEVALAASVLHRYDRDVAYNYEYDDDYDKEKYKGVWQNIFTGLNSISKVELTQEEADLVAKNEQLDLITTAAIVMVDSNHMGKYSDVCFKDGLAGDQLIGNTGNTGIFADFANAFICHAQNAFTIVESPIEFIASLFNGDGVIVTAETVKNRLVNNERVCNNGFVGGLYNGVAKIKDEDSQKKLKELYAQQIIDLANYYKLLYGAGVEEDACTTNTAGITGGFSDWKQYDSKWKDVAMGNSKVELSGCMVTSIAMQIARSGTKLGPLPSGFSEFNPGAFATSLNSNGGFTSDGSFRGSGFQSIAPNWKIAEQKDVNFTNNKDLADFVSKELSSAYDGKYQKYMILRIRHAGSSQHWVAVNNVSNDVVQIYDPASTGTTLDDNYKNWVVYSYSVMYATDVMQGQTGSNNSLNCVGGNDTNRFYAFLAYVEGHTNMCNYKGQGEGTGYRVETLPNDPGGPTTAFGLTASDVSAANKIGYTDFLSELYSGCTNKEKTEQLKFTAQNEIYIPLTEKQLRDAGLTVSEHEKNALISVNYGGTVLAEPIIAAIKTYGKDSPQVFDAFRRSFTNMDYKNALARRRMIEYEMFMTGNYEAESAQYLGWDNMYNKVFSMTKDQVISNWPTQRTEDLDGLDISSTGTSGTGPLKCVNGQAVRSGGNAGFLDGEDIFFNQAQGDWASLPYWFGYTGTVANSGCGLTSMTMCMDVLKGQSWTPKDVYNMRKSLGESIFQKFIAVDALPSLSQYNTQLFGVRSEHLGRSVSEMKEVLNKGGVIVASSGNANVYKGNPWLMTNGKPQTSYHTSGHFVCIWAYRDGAFLVKDPSQSKENGNNTPYTDAQMAYWNENALVPSAIWAVYSS